MDYTIVYMVKATGAKIKETFASPYACRVRMNRIRHGKRCELISWPKIE